MVTVYTPPHADGPHVQCTMDDSKISSVHMVYEAAETREGFHTPLPLSPPSHLLRLTFLLQPLWSISADKGLNGRTLQWGRLLPIKAVSQATSSKMSDFLSYLWNPPALHSPRPSPALRIYSVQDPISPSVLWLCRWLIHR